MANARAVSKRREGRGLQVSSETRTRVDAWKTLKKLQKLARLLRKFFVEKKFTLTYNERCVSYRYDTQRVKKEEKKISRKLKVENFKPFTESYRDTLRHLTHRFIKYEYWQTTV